MAKKGKSKSKGKCKNKKKIIIAVIVVCILILGGVLAWYFWPEKDKAAVPVPSTLCTLDCVPTDASTPGPMIMTQQETEALETVFPGAVFQGADTTDAIFPGSYFQVGTETDYGEATFQKARDLFEELVRRNPGYKDRLLIQATYTTEEATIAPGDHMVYFTVMTWPEGSSRVPADTTTAIPPSPGTTFKIIVDKSFIEGGQCPVCAGTVPP